MSIIDGDAQKFEFPSQEASKYFEIVKTDDDMCGQVQAQADLP